LGCRAFGIWRTDIVVVRPIDPGRGVSLLDFRQLTMDISQISTVQFCVLLYTVYGRFQRLYRSLRRISGNRQGIFLWFRGWSLRSSDQLRAYQIFSMA